MNCCRSESLAAPLYQASSAGERAEQFMEDNPLLIIIASAGVIGGVITALIFMCWWLFQLAKRVRSRVVTSPSPRFHALLALPFAASACYGASEDKTRMIRCPKTPASEQGGV